ncbi:hypothetical protein ATCC90586_006921 [Pythium insidiosum]|nr:hypothetical protein ATCC90586_006921 [Pythium insidiosum]
MELGDFVPLCTAPAGSRELHLRGAGIDVLESARHAARKVAFVAVLQPGDDDALHDGEPGLYVTAKSMNVHDLDAAVLCVTLRHVDLAREPFWGSLLLLLASHLFFVAPAGPITTASFQPLAFLSDFLQWQVRSDGGAKAEDNAAMLKAFVPRLTWVALDLKIKEMEGMDTPTKYFEYKLSNPPAHSVDIEAQMLVNGFFTDRDCLLLKSVTLSTPEGHSSPHVLTSPKIMTHALESIHPKPFFGRFLSGGVTLHLLRSLAHCVTSQSSIVLQRVVENVQLSYWKLLLESALEKYSDTMHARLSVYEKVEFNAEYLVDITERKMQNERVTVVSAGQGEFSSFDEFGNLKRQVSTQSSSSSVDTSTEAQTLDTGIFTFLKHRAGRALSKQISKLTSSTSSASTSDGASALGNIPEDEEAAAEASQRQSHHVSVETPEELLAKYNAPLVAYNIPVEYLKTPSEAMPVDLPVLERVHRQAWNDAKEIILPFLYDLRCTDVKYSELSTSLDLHAGKRNLFRQLKAIRRRFELANEAASTVFCAQLIQYLHTIVLSKNEKDNEAKKSRLGRATSSVIIPDAAGANREAAPLTRLPFELMTYQNNLGAMVSQFNFVARGPSASRVLIGFFQAVVRRRLLALAHKEYNRFADACDFKENKLADLEDTHEDAQRLLQQHQQQSEDFAIQEAKLIAEIEMKNKGELDKLRDAIGSANEMIEKALNDQQALYQSTMQATRKTINTIDQVAVKNRVYMGYLERYEKGHVFSKSWRQYYYVLDHATLKCYKSKSAYEEREPPCEAPITLTGYSVVKSRTDESKIKLIPPEAGQMLRFRAPASVGRDAWMKKFMEATQITSGGNHGR